MSKYIDAMNMYQKNKLSTFCKILESNNCFVNIVDDNQSENFVIVSIFDRNNDKLICKSGFFTKDRDLVNDILFVLNDFKSLVDSDVKENFVNTFNILNERFCFDKEYWDRELCSILSFYGNEDNVFKTNRFSNLIYILKSNSFGIFKEDYKYSGDVDKLCLGFVNSDKFMKLGYINLNVDKFNLTMLENKIFEILNNVNILSKDEVFNKYNKCLSFFKKHMEKYSKNKE